MRNCLKYNVLLILLVFVVSSTGVLAKSTFSGERLRQSCIEYINQTVGGEAVVSISQKIVSQEFEDDGIVAQINSDTKNLKGNTHLAIEFLKNGKIIRRLEVPVRIRIFKFVAVAATTINKGDAVNEGDINQEKEEITYISDNDNISPEEIIGQKAKRNISKGTIFTRNLFENQNRIHRGEKVTLIIKSGAVTIRTSGVALQDADYGSKIRIKREGTQTVLYGSVAMDGSVLISPN